MLGGAPDAVTARPLSIRSGLRGLVGGWQCLARLLHPKSALSGCHLTLRYSSPSPGRNFGGLWYMCPSRNVTDRSRVTFSKALIARR